MYGETQSTGYWMIYNVFSKKWSVKGGMPLYFGMSKFGKMAMLQGRIFYFYELSDTYFLEGVNKSLPSGSALYVSPVYEFLPDGTVLDLKRPLYFEEEWVMSSTPEGWHLSDFNDFYFLPYMKRTYKTFFHYNSK